MSATGSAARPRSFRRVSAEPGEYLIKLRGGRVVRHGPGLSVFLWPGESCAVLPTTIQNTTFVADQITAEKVGVAVSGMAVYRIAQPLLAFRLLDCRDGQTEVLARTLREMFVGAARRLVAAMSVEDCLTRRKESIAAELMREIQPVVSGTGRPDDSTDRGWGIVIDTIEIQDVRILSEKVFADMQAPYRARLELAAKSSAVARDQQVRLRLAEAERSALEVEDDLQRRRSEAEEQQRLSGLARDERVRLAELEGRDRTARAQLEADLAARERTRQLADAEHAVASRRAAQQATFVLEQAEREAELARRRAAELGRAELESAETRVAVERLEVDGAAELAARRAEIRRVEGEVEAWLRRAARESDNLFSDERIRYELVTTALPALARAFAESAGPVHLTRIEGAGPSSGILAQGLAEILAALRAAGLEPERLLGRSGGPERPA